MAANAEMERVREQGWRRGLGNLLSKENGAWWRTRMWLSQVVIWLLVLNGMMAALLWLQPEGEAADTGLPGAAAGTPAEGRAAEGLMVYLIFSGLALPVAAIIIGQDAIIGERQSGTAAWVLSKPVSRPAFIVSKLIAHSLGMLLTMVLVQGLVAYVQVSLKRGVPLAPLNFLGALGLVFLALMFFFTLTMMLGTLFQGRGPVLGISLGLALGGINLSQMFPFLMTIGPFGFTVPAGDSPSLSMALALGLPVTSVTPIVFTALWSVLFIAITLWRFQREEF